MKAIAKVTWVQDASVNFEASPPFDQAPKEVGTHVYDTVLHVYVVYDDETSAEWSEDWREPMPEWAKDAVDAAVRQRVTA